MNTSFKLGSIGLISIALLTACGGGGGGSGTTAANTVSQGTITGFGSVIVDGVRYSSVGAKVQDDEGNAVSRDTLRIGMTVNLTGTSSDGLTSGDAKVIEVRKLLQGPVSGLTGTSAPQTFTVLSQQVQTTASTVIVGTLDTNAQYAKVYGLLQKGSPDTIIASRVEVIPSSSVSKYEVYGRIASLGANNTFNIGNLVVTAASGAIPSGITLAPDQLVKVSCNTSPVTSACSNSATSLTATKVRVLGAKNDLSSGSLVKLHGVIDSINGNLLSVGGVPVDISNASKGDQNGYEAWTPIVGQRIEAKDTYNGSNVLVATRIEQEGYRDSKHAGAAQRYSTELYGIVSDKGTTCAASYIVQSVCVNQGSVTPVPTTGQYVEIKGNMNSTGDVLDVVKVEIKNGSQASGGYIEVKGRVAALDSTAKTYKLDNGSTVDYSKATLEGGTPTLGSYAEAKGTLDSNNILQATKVEVEASSAR